MKSVFSLRGKDAFLLKARIRYHSKEGLKIGLKDLEEGDSTL